MAAGTQTEKESVELVKSEKKKGHWKFSDDEGNVESEGKEHSG